MAIVVMPLLLLLLAVMVTSRSTVVDTLKKPAQFNNWSLIGYLKILIQ